MQGNCCYYSLNGSEIKTTTCKELRSFEALKITPLGGELASSMQLKMLALTEIIAAAAKIKLLITE